MKLLKNIFNVALSNIVGFGTSFLINFMLPAILTVVDYANYKEYILYISFTYLFNLGYNDGVYIKYGGKDPDELDSKVVQEEHNFVIVFQALVFLLMLGFSIWRQNIILICFSFATLFDTINIYHQNLLQATGQFHIYSRGNIIKSAFNIIILLIAIFLFRSTNYVVYIAINVLTFFFIASYYEWYFVKQWGRTWAFNLKGKFDLFRIGFFILIANMSITFVGNVGAWVVNGRYPREAFGYYSFQNSVLNVILLIVNAVGMVFYNVISKRRDFALLNVIKKACIYLGLLAGLAFFVFKEIIHYFLPDYIPAIGLLSITFIAIPYIMLSRILIGNLYKTSTSEKVYFRDSVIYAGLSLLFVWGTDVIFGQLRMVAVATTLCYVFWFLYTTNIKFSSLKTQGREWVLLISHFIIFYITANLMGTLPGLILYILYLLTVMAFNRQDLKDMIAILK